MFAYQLVNCQKWLLCCSEMLHWVVDTTKLVQVCGREWLLLVHNDDFGRAYLFWCSPAIFTMTSIFLHTNTSWLYSNAWLCCYDILVSEQSWFWSDIYVICSDGNPTLKWVMFQIQGFWLDEVHNVWPLFQALLQCSVFPLILSVFNCLKGIHTIVSMWSCVCMCVCVCVCVCVCAVHVCVCICSVHIQWLVCDKLQLSWFTIITQYIIVWNRACIEYLVVHANLHSCRGGCIAIKYHQ